jgi:hypothetical protein
MRLHPLGDGDPGLLFADFGDREVAEPCAAFGDEDAFCRTLHGERFLIHLRHEERCPVTDDMVIVRTLAVIDEVKPVAMRDPVLLRVVVPELAAVIELPWLNGAKIQPVIAHGDVAGGVVAQREVKLARAARDRRFINTATAFERQLRAVLDILQCRAIKGATQHSRAVNLSFSALK